MAIGDFQMFRPSDSAYTNPGELTESWRTMAMERATESSNLERLYRTLEQEESQFSRTFGLNYAKLEEEARQFDDNLAFLYKKLKRETALRSREIDVAESEEDRAGIIDWIKVGAAGAGIAADVFDW